MPKIYLQILNKEQTEILPQLVFLKNQQFYLAGGTALAFQLGHRTSLDFDFYTLSHFDPQLLYQKIEKLFNQKAKITVKEEDTLICNVLSVDLSFFWYKYPLIKKPLETKELLIASLEDIAAMKLISISQRPVKRDYIDVFYLLKVFNLGEMFSFVKNKYPNFNQYFSLRALTYFSDLKDEEERKIKIFDKNFSWGKAKEKIFEEVKKYQLAMIKK